MFLETNTHTHCTLKYERERERGADNDIAWLKEPRIKEKEWGGGGVGPGKVFHSDERSVTSRMLLDRKTRALITATNYPAVIRALSGRYPPHPISLAGERPSYSYSLLPRRNHFGNPPCGNSSLPYSSCARLQVLYIHYIAKCLSHFYCKASDSPSPLLSLQSSSLVRERVSSAASLSTN